VSTARFTREIRIAAPPTAVWWVLATPSLQSAVEPRVRLTGERGEPGTVGSSYELAMRGKPTTHLSVTDAEPGVRHVAAVGWSGRHRGSQEAQLRPDGAGCVLTYTVSIDVPRILRPFQRTFGARQLGRWLEGVARVSTAPDVRQG
jgi:carbon monoxide dehydrogenase subunit G